MNAKYDQMNVLLRRIKIKKSSSYCRVTTYVTIGIDKFKDRFDRFHQFVQIGSGSIIAFRFIRVSLYVPVECILLDQFKFLSCTLQLFTKASTIIRCWLETLCWTFHTVTKNIATPSFMQINYCSILPGCRCHSILYSLNTKSQNSFRS